MHEGGVQNRPQEGQGGAKTREQEEDALRSAACSTTAATTTAPAPAATINEQEKVVQYSCPAGKRTTTTDLYTTMEEAVM